tara:strand:+ start:164 stop:559 length:396 start_codon:yes stop_codon:yes gene_type:complete
MKLNGKIYVKEEYIINILEDIVILLELGNYYEISKSIKDIKPENADNVAVKIAQFQDTFRVMFKKENYCKLDDIMEVINENSYDPKKESVKLYTQGAYGITITADADSIERYVFNVCLYIFKIKIVNTLQN